MDKSRQQFEEWFNDEYETTMKDYDETLVHFVMKQLFDVWKASRESLINNLEPDMVIYRYSNKTNFSFEKSKFNELIQQGFIPLYRLDK